MAENSAYYRDQKRNTREKIDNVRMQLPAYTYTFIDHLLLTYQINTTYVYIHDLFMFFTYLSETNPLCRGKEIKDISLELLNQLTPFDINEFQNYLAYGGSLSRQGEQSRAIARKMSSIRNFFGYMEDNGFLDNDPTLKAAKKSREEENEVFRLDSDEVKQLLDAVTNVNVGSYHSKVLSECTAKRDLALITLLLGTGIRVSECAGIDLNDVNFNTNTIRIVRKGGKATDMYIGESIRNTLRDYINNERPYLLDGADDPALFISLKHNRLSVRSIRYMIEKYGNNLGLDRKLSPHKLRKTYGTALYNKTADIYMVADVLGHKNVNTTIKHYVAMDEKRKQEAAQIDIYDLNTDENP